MQGKKRNWIIVEDSPIRAEELITQIILKHGQEDGIYWVYAHRDHKPSPTFVRDLVNPKGAFSRPNGDKAIVGDVKLYWTKTAEAFTKAFNKIKDLPGILLLDIDLSALGGNVHSPVLMNAARSFIPLGQPKNESLICIVSRVAAYGPVKEEIRANDERIITDGGGKWVFSMPRMAADCREVIEVCDEAWRKHYGTERISLDEFLDKMGELSIEDCHNWQEQIPSRKQEYITQNRWSEDWDMPIQLQHLIQLIGWPPERFIQTFQLRQEQNGFIDGHPICECLKTMGNKDGNSFSLLGAIFIAWAAYRNTVSDGAKEELFVKAIQSLIELKEMDIARRRMITPPQQLSCLKETINALYRLFCQVYISTRPEDQGQDILEEVHLNKQGLSIEVMIEPEPLHKSVSKSYWERVLSKSNETENSSNGGDTSSKIIDYHIRSNYSDAFTYNPKHPFFESDNSLKLIPTSENSITIRLGHENAHSYST